ncbi:MAG: hypothetical protein OHK0053_26720 [Microscillaceae bacterium]
MAQEESTEKSDKKAKRAHLKMLKDSARVYYWDLEKFEELLANQKQGEKCNHEDSLRLLAESLAAKEDSLAYYRQMLAEFEEKAQNPNFIAQENPNTSSPPLDENGRPLLTNSSEDTPPPPVRGLSDKGLVYTVQVGAFKGESEGFYKRIEKEEVVTEQSEGYTKYLIGEFTTLEAALLARRQLLAKGLPQAWVVAYQDGVRVMIKSETQSSSL